MKRREFIALLGCAAAARPLGVHAQNTNKLPTIGFLGASASVWRDYVFAFEQRLRELGWVDGSTVTIAYRWAEGDSERYGDIAAEFVRMKVDVIVTNGSATAAVKKATSTIPIVFAVAADPVGSGLVASLARPGGNVTGLSIESTDLAAKRLGLMREVVPDLHRIGILANVSYRAAALEMSDIETAAHKLGLTVDRLEVRTTEEIPPIIQAHKDVQALYVCPDALTASNRENILKLAKAGRMPAIGNNRHWAEHGALMSYGPDLRAMFSRAADDVDKILKGAKPGDIPVEEPTKFELIINLKTAKTLGIQVPQTLRVTADDVIE